MTMKAMILAAGLGARLRPLTNHIPKALVEVHGQPLIAYHLQNLKQAGIDEVVINLAHLGDQIQQQLGNGQSFGLNIEYSHEGEDRLETGGGILQALPILGHQPFLCINADILFLYPFKRLMDMRPSDGHLILINKPDYRNHGDFDLQDGQLTLGSAPQYLYTGVAVYHPDFILQHAPKGQRKFSMAPLMFKGIEHGTLTGEVTNSPWFDIGTPERLQKAQRWCEQHLPQNTSHLTGQPQYPNALSYQQ